MCRLGKRQSFPIFKVSTSQNDRPFCTVHSPHPQAQQSTFVYIELILGPDPAAYCDEVRMLIRPPGQVYIKYQALPECKPVK